jgi:endonuclease-3
MRNSITDSIISTMLSQNTTDANSKAAWSGLKQAFPEWETVVECDDITKIEESIRVAGLAKTRAERIQNMLRTVKKERGVASLDYIRDFTDEEVKAELSRFKGLGPKTISCVLLFALGRDEFPVDTHVLRIAQKMGWVSSVASREGAYEYLNEMIPNDVKMDLHCLLVRHGKCCHRCAANGRPQFPPEDGSKLDCPLVEVSSWAGSVPADILKAASILLKEDTISPDKVKSEHLPNSNGESSKNKVKEEYVPDKVKSEV